jgi:hypothetical protein
MFLQQLLGFAVMLATHPASQSGHPADLGSQILPGKCTLSVLILVLLFNFLSVSSRQVVKIIILQFLQLLLVYLLGFLLFLLQLGVLAFALLVVILLLIAPCHHVFHLLLIGFLPVATCGLLGHTVEYKYIGIGV